VSNPRPRPPDPTCRPPFAYPAISTVVLALPPQAQVNSISPRHSNLVKIFKKFAQVFLQCVRRRWKNEFDFLGAVFREEWEFNLPISYLWVDIFRRVGMRSGMPSSVFMLKSEFIKQALFSG